MDRWRFRFNPSFRLLDSRGLNLVLLLGVDVLLERDAELFPQGLELLEVLLVLALVLDLGLDACFGLCQLQSRFNCARHPKYCSGLRKTGNRVHVAQLRRLGGEGECIPSKMRTAVAKSLTRRAAFRAAATTEGEGTKS